MISQFQLIHTELILHFEEIQAEADTGSAFNLIYSCHNLLCKKGLLHISEVNIY